MKKKQRLAAIGNAYGVIGRILYSYKWALTTIFCWLICPNVKITNKWVLRKHVGHLPDSTKSQEHRLSNDSGLLKKLCGILQADRNWTEKFAYTMIFYVFFFLFNFWLFFLIGLNDFFPWSLISPASEHQSSKLIEYYFSLVNYNIWHMYCLFTSKKECLVLSHSCLALIRWRFIIHFIRPTLPVSCYIYICC